jgi:uncharacterized integral membrane protein
MRFLNGLFWFLIAVVVSIFTYGNWKHVEINLWSGLIADVNLPLLLLVAFLLGFVPMALWHQAVKWRLRQRLSTAERSIGQLSGPTYPAPAAPVSEEPAAAAPPATV